jgi:hypothetical protein
MKQADSAHAVPASDAAAPPGQRAAANEHEFLRLQRSVGNRATAQLIQRDFMDYFKRLRGVAHMEHVKGEQVIVTSTSEVNEAELLIERIEYRYGVDVSSMKGVAATKHFYSSIPDSEKAKIFVVPWTMRELRAVDRALAHFAPILGRKRQKSTRKDVAQEVTSIGKASTSALRATQAVDPGTLGQYYEDSKNFSLYQRGEVATPDFPGDIDKQLEGTTVHELSHGLMEYALDRFMAATGYWTSRNQESNDPNGEDPPTDYGKNNASEDMAESVMLFFVDNAQLRRVAPRRHAELTDIVSEWSAPVGDFPLVWRHGVRVA